MLSDQQSLLRGILEFPGDYVRREVFADHLEENGETAFAKTIRLGFELHDAIKSKSYLVSSIGDRIFRNAQDELEKERLFGSEGLIILYHDDGPFDFSESYGSGRILDRGFLSAISCTTQYFCENAKRIFELHPITRVNLTDYRDKISHNLRIVSREVSGRLTACYDINAYLDIEISRVGRARIDIRGEREEDSDEYHTRTVHDLLVDYVRIVGLGLPPIHMDRLGKLNPNETKWQLDGVACFGSAGTWFSPRS